MGESTRAEAQDTQSLKPQKAKSISMHEQVQEWQDCCACEAEPYWAEVGKEMGIDPYGRPEGEPQEQEQEKKSS